MALKIIQENENPLFNRKEIVLEIESPITPNRTEVQKIIAEKFKVEPESFKINHILGSFGSKIFKISVNIYPSKEDKDAIEFKSKKEIAAEKKALEEKTKEKESKEKSPEEKVEEKESKEVPAEEEKKEESEEAKKEEESE